MLAGAVSSDLWEKQLPRLFVGIAQHRQAASFLPGWRGRCITRVVFSVRRLLLNCLSRAVLERDWGAFRRDCTSKISIFKGEINAKSFVGVIWAFLASCGMGLTISCWEFRWFAAITGILASSLLAQRR